MARGSPGRCVVVAGGGGRPRAEGGGKIAALPLAAGSLAASGGDGGSGGSARPGAWHSPAPSAPRGADHGCQVGGSGRQGHVTEPGHVTAAQRGGPVVLSCRGEGLTDRSAEPARPAGAWRGLMLLGELGSVRRRSWGTPRSGNLAGGESGAGAAAGRSSWRPLEGNRRNLCARRGGSVPGEGGSPAWMAPAPQGEREALCPGWAAAEGAGR